MALVVKSIGTSSRDYSTIQAWVDDLTNTGVYNNGDEARGECYDDSDFDEAITWSAARNGLDPITLTVATGKGHTGTADTGVRVLASANRSWSVDLNAITNIIEWLELDGVETYRVSITTDDGVNYVRNCLIHDSSVYSNNVIIWHTRDLGYYLNNIVYDVEQNGSGSSGYCYAIDSAYATDYEVYNNTVYRVHNEGNYAAAYAIGIRFGHDDSDYFCKNNIAMGTTKTHELALGQDFYFYGSSNLTSDHNLSEDDTADDGGGSNNQINKTVSNQFVSTTNGSEDLRLKSGADAIDGAEDLGTTPNGVEIDIEGRDRDSEGDTWDIGADEYVAVGGDYEVNIADSITIGESRTVLLPYLTTSIAESIAVGESTTVEREVLISEADSLSVGESIDVQPETLVNVAESLTVGEDVTVEVANWVISVADSLATGEDVTIEPETLINVADVLSLGEDATAEVGALPAQEIDVADGISVTEATNTALADLEISEADAITIGEAITAEQSVHIDVADVVGLAEARTVSVGELPPQEIDVADTVTVDEAIGVALADLEIDLSDTLTVGESATIEEEIVVDVADTLTVGEDPTISVGALPPQEINVADAITVSEATTAILANLQLSVADNISVGESVSLVITELFISVADGVTLGESQTVNVYLPGTALEVDVAEAVTIGEAVGLFFPTLITCLRFNKIAHDWEFVIDGEIVRAIAEAYGEIYTYSSSTHMTIAYTGQWYLITACNNNGESFLTTPDHSNDWVQVHKNGIYQCIANLTIADDYGSPYTLDFVVGKYEGSTKFNNMHGKITLPGDYEEHKTVTLSGLVQLNTNDRVRVYVRDMAETPDFYVRDVNLSVVRVGNV